MDLKAVGALPNLIDQQICYRLYILRAFCLMAPGTGAVKPNVVAFGADQYDLASPHEVQAMMASMSRNSCMYIEDESHTLSRSGYRNSCVFEQHLRSSV